MLIKFWQSNGGDMSRVRGGGFTISPANVNADDVDGVTRTAL